MKPDDAPRLAAGGPARAAAPAAAADAVARLADGLGPGPFALALIFVSPEADLARVAAEADAVLPAGLVIGCTTAGEITGAGYEEGMIVAIGFPASHFAAETVLVPDLARISRSALTNAFVQARQALAAGRPELPHELAILLVDGLSVRVDEFAAALAVGSGAMPLIGGSAGDGTRFRETFVIAGGRPLRDAAVLAVMRSAGPARPISLDHLELTELRMVVTDADPAARLVRRINAEPAAQELARLLGKPPEMLDTTIFAAHPLAVRMGSRHHVRAIQRILPTGEIVFFSAIDEGMVLTFATPADLAEHLGGALAALAAPVRPQAVLAFDCILRRIEAEGKQMGGRVSALLREHGVWGFSTYGEQAGALHVNHTLSGYAFYPPGTEFAEAWT